jgi:hypothetical protein
MELALEIITLLNAASPGIAQLILLIRGKDGTISVGTILDETDTQFAANMKQAADWFAAHPKTP